jgi:hypothetical protein
MASLIARTPRNQGRRATVRRYCWSILGVVIDRPAATVRRGDRGTRERAGESSQRRRALTIPIKAPLDTKEV